MDRVNKRAGILKLSGLAAFYHHSLVQSILMDKVTLISACFVFLVVFSAIFASFISPYPQDGRGETQSLRTRHVPPLSSAEVEGATRFYLLGTDYLGRDLLSRAIYGSRISMTVAFFGVLVSGILGVFLGLISGYYRGVADDIIMRAVDVFMAVPLLILALVLLYVLGPSFINIIIVFAIARWMLYCRISRGVVMSLREQAFVDAARAIGCTDVRIIGKHILPNLVTPILTVASLELPRNILTESALSFLGLGIQPPDSSWGLMLASGRNYIVTASWEVMVPGLAIFFTVCSINLFGIWIRAVSDPLQRWRWLKVAQLPKHAVSTTE